MLNKQAGKKKKKNYCPWAAHSQDNSHRSGNIASHTIPSKDTGPARVRTLKLPAKILNPAYRLPSYCHDFHLEIFRYGAQALVDHRPHNSLWPHTCSPQVGTALNPLDPQYGHNWILYRNLSVSSNTRSALREKAFTLAEAPNHITKRKTRGFTYHREIEMIDSLSNSCSKTLAFLKPYWNLAEM